MAHDKPRAVVVYNTCWYVNRFRLPLLMALEDRGYEVHVVAPFDGAEKALQETGYQVHDWRLSQHGINPLSELRSLVDLYGILQSLSPRVVCSYTIKCNLYTGVTSRLRKFVFLPSVVGLGRVFNSRSFVQLFVTLLFRIAFSRAQKVFFQNREDSETFERLGIISSDRSVVTPGSGVNVSAITPRMARPEDHTPVTFFIFGRLIPAKGFDLFLSAARQVRAAAGERARFWIAGGLDGDSPESKELANRISAAAESGDVVYWGHTDSILDLIQSASVVVLPSTYNEGVPRSLIEGLACGKPIITTDWKGCRETVRMSPRNGWLVRPHSLSDLVEAMESYLSLNAADRAAMGSASRQFAESVFDEERVLNLYLAEIDSSNDFQSSQDL